MKPKQTKQTHRVDEAFDPWEQVRPIPILVLAVFLALALWGLLSYIGDIRPNQDVDVGGTVPAIARSAVSAPHAPAIVVEGNSTVWGCASCHGADGEGAGLTPALANLPENYIAKQLHDFKNGGRLNESMQYVVDGLSEQEILQVASYYANLPKAAAATVNLGGNSARGQALHLNGDWKQNIPACASCHGQNAQGVGEEFPSLAGQQPEYILNQLNAWKGGQRSNSPQSLMDDIASRMSEQDMRDVSQYLGALKPLAAE